jgi:hypothetical protein
MVEVWTCYVHKTLKIHLYLSLYTVQMLRERFKFPVPVVRLLDVRCNIIWLVLCTHPEILAVSVSSDSEMLVPFYETRQGHILKCHHVDCK